MDEGSIFWSMDGLGGAVGPTPNPDPIYRDSSPPNRDTQYLNKELDRLEMVCQAMWHLLKDKLGVTDEQLMGYIAELDLSDGQANGRAKTDGPLICPQCNRPNSRRHDYCIYCGQTLRTKPFG